MTIQDAAPPGPPATRHAHEPTRPARWPDGNLLGFDLETTGVNPFEARPVSFALVSYRSGKKVASTYQLVNPGVPIPPDATAIHHITDEMVQADGMPLADAVAHCREALCDTSAGGEPVVGMVLRYDLTIIDHLDRAHGNRGLETPHWTGPVLDVSLIDRRLDKFRKGRRTLSDLCEVYNVVREEDSAHNAATDAVAAIEVLLELTRAFKILGKTDLATLHARQSTIYQEYLIDLNEHRLRQGLKPIAEYEISGGWPVASMPSTA